MAYSKHLSVKLLLTTVLCGTLAACGGGEQRPQQSYNDERHNAPAAISAQPAHGGATAVRLAKLESDVAMLKNDFSQLSMTYNGLMTTNDRIDALLTRMEQQNAAVPVPVVEKRTPPAKKPDASVAAGKPLPKEPTVMGVRLGEHGDKTRLVIDSSTALKAQTDLDNTEKLLVITLPKTAWMAKETVSGLSSPLVAGWSVQDNGGAKTLAVQLKKPVKVLATEMLKPENGAPGRIVIDLAAAS